MDATYAATKSRILQLCGERNITINRLATMCALPPSSIKNILYGKSQNPKLLTIKLICDGLNMTLGEFFSTPEFDALEPTIEWPPPLLPSPAARRDILLAADIPWNRTPDGALSVPRRRINHRRRRDA